MNLRKIARYLDQLFFRGAGLLFYKTYREREILNENNSDLDYSMRVQYSRNKKSTLNILSDKYGTDKGEISPIDKPYSRASHSYADLYELMFGLHRDNVSLVLECGLGTTSTEFKSSMGANAKPGASLRVWKEQFPKATVVGVDIDQDILFSEDRISTYYCDQTDAQAIRSFISQSNISCESVDITIDDGLHEFEAGISFFEGTIGLLKASGTYIIEDVLPKDLASYKNYFSDKTAMYSARFVSLYTPERRGLDDNRLVVISKV